MKKFKLLVFILAAISFFSINCSPTSSENPEILTASYKITTQKQNYYESLKEWGFCEVYFEITNTGNVEINYYKIYFEATCSDGSKYYDWTNGESVGVGKIVSDMTYINTADKEVVYVIATNIELTIYEYDVLKTTLEEEINRNGKEIELTHY